eukprot:6339560-Lingulodinium_polyedra.AAC.1
MRGCGNAAGQLHRPLLHRRGRLRLLPASAAAAATAHPQFARARRGLHVASRACCRTHRWLHMSHCARCWLHVASCSERCRAQLSAPCSWH